LAVGGTVAPAGAPASNLTFRLSGGFVGPVAVVVPLVVRSSAEFVSGNSTPYYLTYNVPDPSHLLPDGTVLSTNIKYSHSNTGNAFVTELTATTLQPGWNLITRTILPNSSTPLGLLRTFLVFDDIQGPVFQLTSLAPQVIHLADLTAGTIVTIQGIVTDNYQPTYTFKLAVQLNDPKYITPLHSKTDPVTGITSNVVTLTFNLIDKVGNLTVVAIDLTVT
jgi:hypothetical protein